MHTTEGTAKAEGKEVRIVLEYNRRKRNGVNLRTAKCYINKSLSQEIISE